MDIRAIREKFGDAYSADERAFIMGIDRRFTVHFAERFGGRTVLETCTGAGFTTMALAKKAKHVITIDIDPEIQARAKANVDKAGLTERVTFIHGDTLDERLLGDLSAVDAAFLDPDWAVTGPGHKYRFIDANTRPPADALLHRIQRVTANIALVLPPFIDACEFEGLPPHEREALFLNGGHELYCLYFGDLARALGGTTFRV